MAIVNSDVCHVRMDRFTTFEAGVATLSERARAAGHARPWAAYQARHGDLGRTAFITLHENWQSLEDQAPAPEIFAAVLGEEEGARLYAEVNGCLTAVESIVAGDRPELSYADEAVITEPPALLMLTRMRARPGGQDACEELIRKVAEAIPKVDDPMRFRAYQTLVGDRLTYAVSVPLSGLGDMDGNLPIPELLNKAFGPAEGGLIFRSGREAIDQLETTISTLREDLSNLPPQS